MEEREVTFHGERSEAVSPADLPRQRGRSRHRGRRASPSMGRPAGMETGRRRLAGRRGRSPWREPMRRSPGIAPWREPMRRSPGRAPWREPRVRSAGWRGTSPRRARSPRRRSPVRWSGVPCMRSRRSRSLSRSRGERRVRRESPAVVRVTQRGRSPRRRTAPQKRPHQDSAAVRCVQVRIEEVKSQLEVREDGKGTLEEARVVVCEEGTAGAVKETEEERRVVTVEERAGVEKETSDSKAGTTATCDICRVPQRLLRRHQATMVDASTMVLPTREQLLEMSVGRVQLPTSGEKTL